MKRKLGWEEEEGAFHNERKTYLICFLLARRLSRRIVQQLELSYE